MKRFLVVLYCIIAQLTLAQTGISVSPPRLYFETDKGQSNTQKIVVTNASTQNSLDLAISLGDWEYDTKGENMMYAAETLPTSCASWITLKKEDSYFSLKPGERKEIEVTTTAPYTPQDTLNVHTAMLYVTQMNPIDDTDNKGTNIKVSVRSGIKLFHRYLGAKDRKLEIVNAVYQKEEKNIVLSFENTGNIWADGKVFVDIVNPQTGSKTTLNTTVFYTMPGNTRDIKFLLPENLNKGVKYIATLLMDYGEENIIEMAELKFTYE